MPEDSSRRFSLSDVALVIALVPVVLLPQLVGGVHPHVATAAAAIELVALGLLVFSRWGRGRGIVVSWVGAPLFLGLAHTLWQLAPMPRALRRVLSPVGAETASFVTSLLSDDARSHVRYVLSLDPPETAFAAVRLAGAIALFLVVTETARRSRGRIFAYRMLLAGGAALFVVALGHALLNLSGPWGMFESFGGRIFRAPLVNPNHLARMFGGFAFLCLARSLVVRGRSEAFAFAATGVACGAGVFLTLSRGGAVAFAGGVVVFAFLMVRERYALDTRAPWGVQVAAPLLLVAALSVGLWVAYSSIVAELSTIGSATIETSKAALYAPALSLLSDHTWSGVGNSAFGAAFTILADSSLLGGGSTFTHVENNIIETLVDHGVVVGGALLLIALFVAARLVLGLRDAASFAPLPAIAFLVFGDLFDFALEHAAGLYLITALLGLAAASMSGPNDDKRRGRRDGVVIVAVLALVVACCAPSAIGDWRRSLDKRLASLRGAERGPALERALAAHPFDAQYCYLLSVEARRARDPVLALKWANRSMLLWPSLPAPHIEAARALVAQRHAKQAMLEYKTAWNYGGSVLHEVMKGTSDAKLRRLAIPDTTPALSLFCRALTEEKRLDDAQSCADEVAARPDATEADVRAALELALARKDVDGARQRLVRFKKGSLDGASAVAALRAIELVEGLDPARAQSRTWLTTSKDSVPLLHWQLDAAIRGGDLDEAKEMLPRLRAMASSVAALEQLDRLEANLLRRAGELGKLRVLLMRLVERRPRDASLIAQMGHVELDLDQTVQARMLYERAARVDPANAEVKRLAARLGLVRDAP